MKSNRFLESLGKKNVANAPRSDMENIVAGTLEQIERWYSWLFFVSQLAQILIETVEAFIPEIYRADLIFGLKSVSWTDNGPVEFIAAAFTLRASIQIEVETMPNIPEEDVVLQPGFGRWVDQDTVFDVLRDYVFR